jgi:hypothetical protein
VRGAAIGKSFRERADSACFFEAWVGSCLSREGITTIHHPFTLASETGRPLSAYATSWDLTAKFIYEGPDAKVGGARDSVRMEVKSSKMSFTHAHNFPTEKVLVCSKKNWDAKGWENITVRPFVYVSRVTGKIVWLPPGNPVITSIVTDRTRGETYDCVCVRKDRLRDFADLVRWIKS